MISQVWKRGFSEDFRELCESLWFSLLQQSQNEVIFPPYFISLQQPATKLRVAKLSSNYLVPDTNSQISYFSWHVRHDIRRFSSPAFTSFSSELQFRRCIMPETTKKVLQAIRWQVRNGENSIYYRSQLNLVNWEMLKFEISSALIS